MRSSTSGELAELVRDLRGQVAALEKDLTERALDPGGEFDARLRGEYAEARTAKRTAAVYSEWLRGRVTQAAAAWVLATVFVRYCEDNELVEWPFLAGPGERFADAEERHEAHFRAHPEQNDRDWLLAAFAHLAESHPTVAGLFDAKHNPLWDITPSYPAAGALLAFWRRRGADGDIRWHFDGWDTRFLGDLYQDLSEYARKQYALLQTPEFVEEFILDLTLDPAIEEFGLEDLRTIDPTCGSGHFVLGLFRRLLARWRATAPGADDWDLIRRSLESVHGVDKNPFAVSVARFRLLVAVLAEGGVKRLDAAPQFPLNLAVGDSLLHGRGAPRLAKDDDKLFDVDEDGEWREYTYSTEDVDEFRHVDLLGRQSYHVVVGNPPYITVKDKAENENYRRRYDACSGQYALSVPFAQRFFDLAIKTGGDDRRAGFVGQITANSFMKREFGKKFIEEFLAQSVHVSHLIDTSGAYVPGHGTPTVIILGRHHIPYRHESIRAVMGIRGEPAQPSVLAEGLVWQAIIRQIDRPGSQSEWVSVEDLERSRLLTHPMSLGGGGAADVKSAIENGSDRFFRQVNDSFGFICVTREDDAYLLREGLFSGRSLNSAYEGKFVQGADIEDWRPVRETEALFTHGDLGDLVDQGVLRLLWPSRELLLARRSLSGTQEERGVPWHHYSAFSHKRWSAEYSILLRLVATQPQFVLRRDGVLATQAVTCLLLDQGATEDDHLELLGVLNSSTACFWLKQVSQGKGGSGIGCGIKDEDWEERYEFTGTKLQEFPLPRVLPLELGRELDRLAQQVGRQEPSAVCAEVVPSRAALDAARRSQECLRQRMIALQEELDWTVYHSYDLLSDAERAATTVPELADVPEVKLGERAFEIVLARTVAAGEAETAWFARHGSEPVTEIPQRWPESYRVVVQTRIDLIEKRRDLALIERPECKRRWSVEQWTKREERALRTWLLDRCERRDLWYGLRDGFVSPRPMTVSQLADRFRDDADLQSVAALYATDHLGRRDAALTDVLDAVIADEHVPYLAALRYKDSGLVKRAAWEEVWESQREEDRTGGRLDIPVPPKYGSADFRKPSYWSQRGKLDVPKERFVSYPGASPDADPTLLLGWAGWDHKDQAAALVGLVTDRATDAGWGTDRLTPLLAGLLEVLPWVRQWHGAHDDEWGGNPAEDIAGFLTEERTKRGLTEEALRAWRPQPARRGRRGAS